VALGLAPWGRTDALGPVGEVAFQVLLPTTIGLYIRRSRQLVRAHQQRAESLQLQQELVAERAVLRERARIAQEVHDALGHQLSIVVLHAGALALTGGSAAERGELIRIAGKEAMQDLRRVIGVLSDGEPNNGVGLHTGLQSVRELVSASRRAGVPIEATLAPELEELDSSLRNAVQGVLREALTNVHKHAGHVRTRISVQYRGGEGLRVEVHNEAPTSPPATCGVGSGSGLVAMAERVRLLGGHFEHGATPSGGFFVRACFPPKLEQSAQ
jgi:signal transduction histidine kinase